MAGNEERRPADGGGAQDAANVSTIAKGADVDVPELIEQLQRRREAARRLPVLACGHADPIDCLRVSS